MRGTRNNPAGSRRGFTLVELVVASIIAAMVAGATAASVASLARARSKASARQSAFARAELAASRIAMDLRALVRDADLKFAHLSVLDALEADEDRDQLLMLSRALRPVWGDPDLPEGGAFEVQYRVQADPETGVPALWRRIDPAFDMALDGGGLASVLAPGVVSLNVEALDVDAWASEWDSDSDGMPHAVRVTLAAMDDEGTVTAVARRVVAIDRVPIPPEEEEEEGETTEETDAPQGETTTSPSTGGSGGGGGGGRPGGGGGGPVVRPGGGGQRPGGGTGGNPGGGARPGGGGGGSGGPAPGGRP